MYSKCIKLRIKIIKLGGEEIFMRKVMIGIIILFLFLISNVMSTVNASSSLSQYTKEFILSMVCENETTCYENELKVKSEQIYDIFLTNIGKVYEYTYADDFGYVISRKTKFEDHWIMEIIEASSDTKSPYNQISSKNIYISYGNYFEYKDDLLVDSLTGDEINYQDIISYFNERLFIGAMGQTTVTTYTEEYSYYSKTTTRTETDGGFPTLSTDLNTSVTNNCSPTAGTEIIMYWDRYETNLISNFTPTYTTIVGVPPYSYYYVTKYRNWDNITSSQLDVLEDLHDDLYADMYTNNWYIPLWGSVDGTYPPFFYNALEDYFDSKNLDLSYNSLIYGPNTPANTIGEQLDWAEFTAEIDLDYPVVMQLGVDPSMDYELYVDSESIEYDDYYFYTYYGQKVWYDTVTRIYKEYSNSAHTVVGYGYTVIDYYKINYYGNLYKSKTDKYFVVANGWGGTSLINSTNSDISIAYSVFPN